MASDMLILAVHLVIDATNSLIVAVGVELSDALSVENVDDVEGGVAAVVSHSLSVLVKDEGCNFLVAEDGQLD